MNRSALKKYAPQARLDFIEAVTLRARHLGLDPALPVNIEQTGDVLLIGGQPFPASIAKQRATLAQRIQQQSFTVVVEALAYTWFNRLVAIRFMELKGYLNHGYRVLSHPQGLQPEILDHVQHLELTGLDKAEVIRLKTAGNQDEALYREILLAQCHELHRNMPFLFEALDDATELLLPDNLLRTDSPIVRLVSDIEEGDWQEVEVIGWLYQFYISEKKDEVIGKVVKSGDIPAATQLFTPNWIVQYLVQNSLGRLWLMANPGSSLKEKMPYYIEPAEQTLEVQAQLDALIKVRIDEDDGTLNPESLTVLDPACGSGHILVEAYSLLRAIYEERGYRLRDIPRLILQKNLFGLDIDDRAAQLAGFALLMKAREDDRRLFDDEDNPPHLNVMALQQSSGLPDESIANTIINAAIQIEGGEAFQSGQLFGGGQLETQHSSGLTVLDLRQLIQLFEHGKTFGSLISVPGGLKVKLDKLMSLLMSVRNSGDELSRSYASLVLEQFAWPASILALQYDVVVANPPYMGVKYYNSELKIFVDKNYKVAKGDLYTCFIMKNISLAKDGGFVAVLTIPNWMFLSTFEKFRAYLFDAVAIDTFSHNGRGVFGSDFGSCACVFIKQPISALMGSYVRLFDKQGSVASNEELSERFISADFYKLPMGEFSKIPGSPIAYWASEAVRKVFQSADSLGQLLDVRQGLATSNNGRFLRLWYEVSFSKIGLSCVDHVEASSSGKKWFPHSKGGGFRKWYGNREWVVDWENNGLSIKENILSSYPYLKTPEFVAKNPGFYFKSSVSWTLISSAGTAFRYEPAGNIMGHKGPGIFGAEEELQKVLCFLNSKVSSAILQILAPTIGFEVGQVAKLPVLDVGAESGEAVSIARDDWDSSELSWDFTNLFLVASKDDSLAKSWIKLCAKSQNKISRMKDFEESNNRLFIEAYGLQEEISPTISENEITLDRADRERDMIRLLSYAIGCMMGRYSLDEPSLIYAHGGNVGFDLTRYRIYPADLDGIMPITDESWFEDDATERMRDFVKVVWGEDTLVENMEWLSDSLGRKSGESADEAIRRYLSTSFYKDHLQTYKKRPIYWLFSSGKQKAFECLVYLHRYNEGTLSRMRMEYVVPLQSRMQARIDKLADDINSSIGSVQQKAIQKRKDKLTKQLEELRRFDETLRPYADQRIALNLDDGVKVNYGKFGDLLAEVKVITGGKED